MTCCQCSKLAIYQVGDQKIPLCLDCYFKFSQIQQREFENNERMMNFAIDQIDDIVGFGRSPRLPPRPQPVYISGVKMNNISVKNSVVGTINTGSIGTVDQSISALIQLGESESAEAFKSLAEAILQSGDLTRNQQNELIEILSVLSKEAATPPQSRENSVAHTLLEKAIKISSVANDITDICQKWWPVLAAVFCYTG
jgi:hypothetical protein